jgi:superfamily II DNA or RNA helicase
MKEGFYEQIITEALSYSLKHERDKVYLAEPFNKSEGSVLIQRYFQVVLRRALDQISGERDELAKKKLIDFTNRLVDLTAEWLEDPAFGDDRIAPDGEVLKAIFREATYAQTSLEDHCKAVFPLTGLSESALFNGSKHMPSLESELKKEMLTSDEAWWLVSFLKFEGVRLFEQVLRKLESAGKKVKIICTVYMGATDLKAIEFLSGFSNVEIKISFNTNQERLHAKSYLFIRNSGFHTAYIGSSNLSRSALTNGLEWNVKVTQQEIPHILSKCKNTFETYWNDSSFELYQSASHREKLKAALENGKSSKREDDASKFFELAPFPFQQQILDRLQYCREQGEMKNLVVAATGTGKTMISAFDFKRFLKNNPRATFLFVAHREEILRQARYTFRQVLKNNDFGELWCSGEKPSGYQALFVSVQTLNNRMKDLLLDRGFYDYIVIDEVHHSVAFSYQNLLSFFAPKVLLGLTATPERHDGEDVTKYFGHTISAEIRLPDALNQKLLCPFQYFGICDSAVDISSVTWRGGRYDLSELENIYTHSHQRVRDIIRNCDKYLTDIKAVRALGFCVSKKHAEFMSSEFNRNNLRSAFLHAGNGHERKELVHRLKIKEIQYLFVVDIFNEGIDIPEIDTLLFLRPTESLTVFIQQLGRGLRLHEDKTCLTVLDFVGNQHAEYSFEHKFRAMIGKTHSRIKDELRNDFPNLPLGCSVTLEETARKTILENLERSYRSGQGAMLTAMRRFTQDYVLELNLTNFCTYMDIDLFALYKSKQLFFELKNKYKGIVFDRQQSAVVVARVLGSTWLTTDSESYFRFLLKLISGEAIDCSLKIHEQYLLMCYIDLFDEAPRLGGFGELYDELRLVFADNNIKNEVLEYLRYRIGQTECIEKPIALRGESVLKLHARYSRSQILAALSESSLQKKASSREGVYRIECLNMELLFVTLFKESGRFNPSTMYDDYFTNEQFFHWQSQNSTAPESEIGQSYIRQSQLGKEILLFVRESSKDENGLTMSFVFCGKLHYLQHEGRKPMSITWRLETPPPALLLEEGKKLGVG